MHPFIYLSAYFFWCTRTVQSANDEVLYELLAGDFTEAQWKSGAETDYINHNWQYRVKDQDQFWGGGVPWDGSYNNDDESGWSKSATMRGYTGWVFIYKRYETPGDCATACSMYQPSHVGTIQKKGEDDQNLYSNGHETGLDKMPTHGSKSYLGWNTALGPFLGSIPISKSIGVHYQALDKVYPSFVFDNSDAGNVGSRCYCFNDIAFNGNQRRMYSLHQDYAKYWFNLMNTWLPDNLTPTQLNNRDNTPLGATPGSKIFWHKINADGEQKKVSKDDYSHIKGTESVSTDIGGTQAWSQYFYHCEEGEMWVPEAIKQDKISWKLTEQDWVLGTHTTQISINYTSPDPYAIVGKPCIACPRGTYSKKYSFHARHYDENGGQPWNGYEVGILPMSDARETVVCPICPNGWYQDQKGQSSCKNCNSALQLTQPFKGQYSDPVSQRTYCGKICDKDGDGTYHFSVKKAQCVKTMCPRGKAPIITARDASWKEETVSVGDYPNWVNNELCQTCPQGYFQGDPKSVQTRTIGPLYCTECPVGYTTTGDGFNNRRMCNRCPEGWKTNGKHTHDGCETCPDGKLVYDKNVAVNLHIMRGEIDVGDTSNCKQAQSPFYAKHFTEPGCSDSQIDDEQNCKAHTWDSDGGSCEGKSGDETFNITQIDNQEDCQIKNNWKASGTCDGLPQLATAEDCLAATWTSRSPYCTIIQHWNPLRNPGTAYGVAYPTQAECSGDTITWVPGATGGGRCDWSHRSEVVLNANEQECLALKNNAAWIFPTEGTCSDAQFSNKEACENTQRFTAYANGSGVCSIPSGPGQGTAWSSSENGCLSGNVWRPSNGFCSPGEHFLTQWDCERERTWYGVQSSLFKCKKWGFLVLNHGGTEDDCDYCSAGKKSVLDNEAMVNTCVDCPMGRHSEKQPDRSICVDCKTSQYQDQVGQSSCKHCSEQNGYPVDKPPGTDTALLYPKYHDLNKEEDASNCKFCYSLKNANGETEYCERSGALNKGFVKTKQICPKGHECKRGLIYEADPGEDAPNFGTHKCKNCVAGYFSDEFATHNCKECIQGRYVDHVEAAECDICPLGTYQDTTAADSLDDCKGCPEGYTATYERTHCEICPTGFFQEPGSLTRSCQTCNPGLFAPEDNRMCTYPAHAGLTRGNAYVYNCDGSCKADTDRDGICDEFERDEVEGCMDPSYCEFDRKATSHASESCKTKDQAETCMSLYQRGALSVQDTAYSSYESQFNTADPTNAEKICVLAEQSGDCINIVGSTTQSLGSKEILRQASINLGTAQNNADSIDITRLQNDKSAYERELEAITPFYDCLHAINTTWLNASCSDPQFADQSECLANNNIWEDASCSDTQFDNQADCKGPCRLMTGRCSHAHIDKEEQCVSEQGIWTSGASFCQLSDRICTKAQIMDGLPPQLDDRNDRFWEVLTDDGTQTLKDYIPDEHARLTNAIAGAQSSIQTGITTNTQYTTNLANAQTEYDDAFDTCKANQTCISSCTDPRACNYCAVAPCPFEACIFPLEGRTCPPAVQEGCLEDDSCELVAMGTCLRDQINPKDSLCDEDERMGCTDVNACNFDHKATYRGYVLCEYAPPFRKCRLPSNNLTQFISDTTDNMNNLTTAILNLNASKTELQPVSGCSTNSTDSIHNNTHIFKKSIELEIDLFSVAQLQQFALRRANNIANDNGLSWVDFFNSVYNNGGYSIDTDRYTDLALATCALNKIVHQLDSETQQALEAELSGKITEKNRLQKDLKQAEDQKNVYDSANANANAKEDIMYARQNARDDAKSNLTQANLTLENAKVAESTAIDEFDAAFDNLKTFEATWGDSKDLYETQQSLIEALLSTNEQADVTAHVTVLNGHETNMLQAKLNLDAQQSTVQTKSIEMEDTKTRREEAEVDKEDATNVFGEKEALYNAALADYDQAKLELGLSSEFPCIKDENNDNVCDEEDPHQGCGRSKCNGGSSEENDCTCNKRSTEMEPVEYILGKIPNCTYCEWGKYTESMCDTGANTLKSVHTYDPVTSETVLTGDCEDPSVETEWLNQYECLDCPAGWFGEADNRRCSRCPIGTYQDEPGKAGCKTCSLGKKEFLEDGATSCNDCDADAVPPWGNDEFGNCELCDPAQGKILNRETGRCEYIVCSRGKGYKFIPAVGDEPATGFCMPCIQGISYSSTANHLPCQPVENCEDGYGGTFAPEITTLTNRPVCIDSGTVLLSELDQLKNRINQCLLEENCDTIMPSLKTGLLTSFIDLAKNKINFNANIGMWDTDAVVDMESTFEGAEIFDQDIGGWGTSSVTKMKNMFKGTHHFNHNVEDWDTKNVEDMEGMFQDAVAFNQDLSSWDLRKVKIATKMFDGAKVFDGVLPNMPVLTHVKGMFSHTSYTRDISHLTFPKMTREWVYANTTNWYTRAVWNYRLKDVLPASYQTLVRMPHLVDPDTFAKWGDRIDYRWTTRHPCRFDEFAKFSVTRGVRKILDNGEMVFGDRYDKTEWDCVKFTQCDYDTHWMSFPGTPSEDVRCSKLTDCTGGTFFIREKTETSDRVCVDFTTYFKAAHINDADAKVKILESMDKSMLEAAYTDLMSQYPCTHKYGFVAADFDCVCGTETCQTGTFCRASDSRCLTIKATLQTPMQCPSTEEYDPNIHSLPMNCNPGSHCVASQSMCISYQPTLDDEDSLICRQNPQLNEAMCICRSNTTETNCKAEQYCNDGECSDTPFCLDNQQYDGVDYSFRVRNENVCKCGDNACRKGEACDPKFKICTGFENGFCNDMNPGNYNENFKFLSFAPSGKTSGEYEACEGPCFDDDDCSDGFNCFLRNFDYMAGIVVPGCKGHYLEDPNANFCYDPAMMSNLVPLKMRFEKISFRQNYNLGECEAHCKSHIDCSPGLSCWNRGGTTWENKDKGESEAIPGCTGDPEALDRVYDYEEDVWNRFGTKVDTLNYCYDPTKSVIDASTDNRGFYSLAKQSDGNVSLNIFRDLCQCGSDFASTSQWCDHTTGHSSDDLLEIKPTVNINGTDYEVCPFNRQAVDATRDLRISSAYLDGSKHDHEGQYQSFYKNVSGPTVCACAMTDAFRYDDDCIQEGNCLILNAAAGETKQCQPIYGKVVDVNCGHENCTAAYDEAKSLRDEYREAQGNRSNLFYTERNGGHCYETYRDYYNDTKLEAMKTGGRLGDLSHYRLKQFRVLIDNYEAETGELIRSSIFLPLVETMLNGQVKLSQQNITEIEFYNEFPRSFLEEGEGIGVFSNLSTFNALGMKETVDQFNGTRYTPEHTKFQFEYYVNLAFNLSTARDFLTAYHSSQSVRGASIHTTNANLQQQSEDAFHNFYLEGECAIFAKHPGDTSEDKVIGMLNKIYVNARRNDKDNARYNDAPYARQECALAGCAKHDVTHTPSDRRLTSGSSQKQTDAETLVSEESETLMEDRFSRLNKFKQFRNAERQKARKNNRYSGWCAPPAPSVGIGDNELREQCPRSGMYTAPGGGHTCTYYEQVIGDGNVPLRDYYEPYGKKIGTYHENECGREAVQKSGYYETLTGAQDWGERKAVTGLSVEWVAGYCACKEPVWTDNTHYVCNQRCTSILDHYTCQGIVFSDVTLQYGYPQATQGQCEWVPEYSWCDMHVAGNHTGDETVQVDKYGYDPGIFPTKPKPSNMNGLSHPVNKGSMYIQLNGGIFPPEEFSTDDITFKNNMGVDHRISVRKDRYSFDQESWVHVAEKWPKTVLFGGEFTYSSVSTTGYCSDTQHLIDGAWPPRLDNTHPLYDSDPAQECMNRCVHDSRIDTRSPPIATHGFSLKENNLCACSHGSCTSTDAQSRGVYNNKWIDGELKRVYTYEPFFMERGASWKSPLDSGMTNLGPYTWNNGGLTTCQHKTTHVPHPSLCQNNKLSQTALGEGFYASGTAEYFTKCAGNGRFALTNKPQRRTKNNNCWCQHEFEHKGRTHRYPENCIADPDNTNSGEGRCRVRNSAYDLKLYDGSSYLPVDETNSNWFMRALYQKFNSTYTGERFEFMSEYCPKHPWEAKSEFEFEYTQTAGSRTSNHDATPFSDGAAAKCCFYGQDDSGNCYPSQAEADANGGIDHYVGVTEGCIDETAINYNSEATYEMNRYCVYADSANVHIRVGELNYIKNNTDLNPPVPGQSWGVLGIIESVDLRGKSAPAISDGIPPCIYNKLSDDSCLKKCTHLDGNNATDKECLCHEDFSEVGIFSQVLSTNNENSILRCTTGQYCLANDDLTTSMCSSHAIPKNEEGDIICPDNAAALDLVQQNGDKQSCQCGGASCTDIDNANIYCHKEFNYCSQESPDMISCTEDAHRQIRVVMNPTAACYCGWQDGEGNTLCEDDNYCFGGVCSNVSFCAASTGFVEIAESQENAAIEAATTIQTISTGLCSTPLTTRQECYAYQQETPGLNYFNDISVSWAPPGCTFPTSGSYTQHVYWNSGSTTKECDESIGNYGYGKCVCKNIAAYSVIIPCACGAAGPADTGDYCKYDPGNPTASSVGNSPFSVSECTGDHYTGECSCGTAVCDQTFQKCRSERSQCSQPGFEAPAAMSDRGEASLCEASICRCGGDACGDDDKEYCFEGTCHSWCGGELCKDFCFNNVCRKYDECDDPEGWTVTGANCTCGTSDCTESEYCYKPGNLCMNSARTIDACFVVSGDMPTVSSCLCGDNVCSAGDYCVKKHHACTTTPPQFVDHTFASGVLAADATCGIDRTECTKTYCMGGECKDADCNSELCDKNCIEISNNSYTCTDLSLCQDNETQNQEACACALNEECEAGDYCVEGQCLKNPVCTNTDGGSPVGGQCACGTNTCSPGQYCHAEFNACSDNALTPTEASSPTVGGPYKLTSGSCPKMPATQAECHALKYEQWRDGAGGPWIENNGITSQSAYASPDYPPGCWVYGSTLYWSSLTSGDVCGHGEPCVCIGEDVPGIERHLDCSAPGSDCNCGGTQCSKKCFESGGCGDTAPPSECLDTTGTALVDDCLCGTQTCPDDWSEYCNQGECVTTPPCSNTDGTVAFQQYSTEFLPIVTITSCTCQGATCTDGQFCDGGVCRNSGSCPNKNRTVAAEADCKCGGYECTTEQFCDGENCHDTALCQGAGPLSSKCACGHVACEAGQYCTDSQCGNTPPCAGENDVNAAECQCGGSVCDENSYCRKSLSLCSAIAFWDVCEGTDGQTQNVQAVLTIPLKTSGGTCAEMPTEQECYDAYQYLPAPYNNQGGTYSVDYYSRNYYVPGCTLKLQSGHYNYFWNDDTVVNSYSYSSGRPGVCAYEVPEAVPVTPCKCGTSICKEGEYCTLEHSVCTNASVLTESAFYIPDTCEDGYGGCNAGTAPTTKECRSADKITESSRCEAALTAAKNSDDFMSYWVSSYTQYQGLNSNYPSGCHWNEYDAVVFGSGGTGTVYFEICEEVPDFDGVECKYDCTCGNKVCSAGSSCVNGVCNSICGGAPCNKICYDDSICADNPPCETTDGTRTNTGQSVEGSCNSAETERQASMAACEADPGAWESMAPPGECSVTSGGRGVSTAACEAPTGTWSANHACIQTDSEPNGGPGYPGNVMLGGRETSEAACEYQNGYNSWTWASDWNSGTCCCGDAAVYTTQSACIGSYIDYGPAPTWITLEGGSCSDPAYTTQEACENSATWTIPSETTACSNPLFTGQTACESSAGEWTPGPNEKCECGTALCGLEKLCDSSESTCSDSLDLFFPAAATQVGANKGYLWKTSGNCEEPITTSEECLSAMSSGLSDKEWTDAPASHDGTYNYPSGCYEVAWGYTFNSYAGQGCDRAGSGSGCLCVSPKHYDCSTTSCQCGTSQNCQEQCDGGVCTCRDDLFHNIQGDSCRCGSMTCAAGERCVSGQCINVANCVNDNGVYAGTEALCICGTVTCSAGEYCKSHTSCSDKPLACTNTDQTAPMNYPEGCQCGGGEICEYGEYCNANACHEKIRDCDENTAESITLERCTCGEASCTQGNYCYDGACRNAPKCTGSSGLKVESDACYCKDQQCKESNSCIIQNLGFNRVVNLGASKTVCANIDGSVVNDPSDSNYYRKEMTTIKECADYCTTRTDATNTSYTGFRHEQGASELHSNMRGMCYCTTENWADCAHDKLDMKPYYQFDFAAPQEEAKCLDNPLCPDITGFDAVVTTPCTCDDSTCNTGKYCFYGECRDTLAKCLDAFGLTSTDKTCTCGSTTCNAGQFCNQGQCEGASSTNYMVVQESQCNTLRALSSLEACSSFCEETGNPVDAGNCLVRDVAGEDGNNVTQHYPPGCSLHTVTGRYFWNSKNITNITCGNGGYSCVCYVNSNHLPVCSDSTGLLPTTSACRCESVSECRAEQYCFKGGCHNEKTYESTLQEENCVDLVPSSNECKYQCLAGFHHLDDVIAEVRVPGAACTGTGNEIFSNSAVSVWENKIHTGSTCKDVCLTKMHADDLGITASSLASDDIPSPMYFTLQKSADNSRSRCVCHKLSDTKNHECYNSGNLYYHDTYDVFEIVHRELDMSGHIAHSATVLRGGTVCRSPTGDYFGSMWYHETADTGRVSSSVDECRTKCKHALETGQLNNNGWNYNSSDPGVMYISNKINGYNRKCLCHYPGRIQTSQCEDEANHHESPDYELIKYDWKPCAVQEVNTPTTPPGCSLNTDKLTYYYNSETSSDVSCENSDSHMCVCGPRNDACTPTNGKVAHNLNKDCLCGTSICTRDEYCLAESDECLNQPVCSNTEGNAENTEDCRCGTTNCTAGQFCDKSNNACMDGGFCPIQEISTPLQSECTCGGETCGSGKFCEDNKCLVFGLCSMRGATGLSSEISLSTNYAGQNIPECHGQCTSDNDCADGLRCFHVETSYWDKIEIPGCTQDDYAFTDTTSDNFCYDPRRFDEDTFVAISQDDDSCTTAYCQAKDKYYHDDGTMAGTGWNGDCREGTESAGTCTQRNIPECHGHCNNDGDCATGLICYKSGNDAHVPGCSGISPAPLLYGVEFNPDFCIDPAKLTGLPLDRTYLENFQYGGDTNTKCNCGESTCASNEPFCYPTFSSCSVSKKNITTLDSGFSFLDCSKGCTCKSEWCLGNCLENTGCDGPTLQKSSEEDTPCLQDMDSTVQCACAGGALCEDGDYCDSSIGFCTGGPQCAGGDGITQANEKCWCGIPTVTCDINQYCNAGDQKCYDVKKCSDHDGLHANFEPCVCGAESTYCNPGTYCDATTNSCNYYKKCDSENGQTEFTSTGTQYRCTCGTEMCRDGEYCHLDSSSCFPGPPCEHTNGEEKTTELCQCPHTGGGFPAVCAPNQWCYNSTGQCKNQPNCLYTEATTDNTGACTCGDALICLANEPYCSENTQQCLTTSFGATCSNTPAGKFVCTSPRVYDDTNDDNTAPSDANCCKDPATCGASDSGLQFVCAQPRVYDDNNDDNTAPSDANCCKDPPFVATCGEITDGGGEFASCTELRVYDATQAGVTSPSDANCCMTAQASGCGLEDDQRVCPPQLNAAGFTQGSVHAKLSGPPGSKVKKWYKVTQAFNFANPSGSAANEKPEQGHYGIKLQYCGGGGTGGPYDSTTCDTTNVDFYEGGCASHDGELSGECPMIYSLATAMAKEQAADEHVDQGGGCNPDLCTMAYTSEMCSEPTYDGCEWTGSSCTCPGSHSDGSGGGTSFRCLAVDPSGCGPDCYSYNSICIPNAYYNNACWGHLYESYCNGGGCVWDASYGVCVLDSIQDDYL